MLLIKPLVEFLKKQGIYVYRKAHESDFELRKRIQSELIRQSRGILHVGAHLGQEGKYYFNLGKKVLWIEANPEIYEKLCENIRDFTNQSSICALLGEESGNVVEFNIASNDGASSSIYPPNTDLEPPFEMTSAIKLTIHRLDSIVEIQEIMNLDHWVVDVQGAELPVLRSSGDYINYCNSLVIEAKEESYYRGGTKYSDLLTFLLSKGFIPLWAIEEGVEDNVFFIRTKNRLEVS
jgi:FkbM family methyltransferase